LLPTATENILEALPVEELTQELQKKRAERLARLNGAEVQSSDPGSATTSVTDDDGRSLASFQTDSYIHTGPAGGSNIEGDGQRLKKSKAQLWNEVKITGACGRGEKSGCWVMAEIQ
jgi:peroxin-3